MVHMFPVFLCLILAASLCSALPIDLGKSDNPLGWQTLCPFMVGSVVANSSFLDSADFLEAYNYYQQNGHTCDYTTCTESLHRLACEHAIARANLLEVNVDLLFPHISYNKVAPLATLGKSVITPTPTPIPTPTSPSTSNKTRIAYVVLVHEGYAQTVRLLSAIYHPDNSYVLHIDGKSPSLKNDLISHTAGFPNVYVLERSFDVGWGAPEMVYATLEGIFALLDMSDKWDFVINLSAKDYPLCNDEELSTYLGTRIGKNFDVAVIPSHDDEKYWRARSTYAWCNKAPCYQKHQRKLPNEVDSYVGSQWFVYSRDFAQYLRSNAFPKLMLAHYEHTWIADEGYFGTVLMGSPFRSTRVHHNLRYIVFDQIHPYYWREEHFPVLERQIDSCFSRKFEENSSVLNLLDAMRTRGGRNLQLP